MCWVSLHSSQGNAARTHPPPLTAQTTARTPPSAIPHSAFSSTSANPEAAAQGDVGEGLDGGLGPLGLVARGLRGRCRPAPPVANRPRVPSRAATSATAGPSTPSATPHGLPPHHGRTPIRHLGRLLYCDDIHFSVTELTTAASSSCRTSRTRASDS